EAKIKKIVNENNLQQLPITHEWYKGKNDECHYFDVTYVQRPPIPIAIEEMQKNNTYLNKLKKHAKQDHAYMLKLICKIIIPYKNREQNDETKNKETTKSI
ncbi:MAG: hypothetical protein QW594_03145, partial [Candidatus Woesearchaeota archaeon]